MSSSNASNVLDALRVRTANRQARRASSRQAKSREMSRESKGSSHSPLNSNPTTPISPITPQTLTTPNSALSKFSTPTHDLSKPDFTTPTERIERRSFTDGNVGNYSARDDQDDQGLIEEITNESDDISIEDIADRKDDDETPAVVVSSKAPAYKPPPPPGVNPKKSIRRNSKMTRKDGEEKEMESARNNGHNAKLGSVEPAPAAAVTVTAKAVKVKVETPDIGKNETNKNANDGDNNGDNNAAPNDPISVIATTTSTTKSRKKSTNAVNFSPSLKTFRYLLTCGKNPKNMLLGYSQPSLLPSKVDLFCNNVKHISAGRDHTVALSNEGRVYSWGKGDDGRLGVGSEEDSVYPRVLKYGMMWDVKIVQVSCGEMHSMSLCEAGRVFAWGRNYYGRLGLGDSNNRSVPEVIRSLMGETVGVVSAGVAYSCAVTRAGKVYTWGYGGHGQLGHSNTKNYDKPKKVEALDDEIVQQMSAAYGHTLCVTASGEVYSWGSGHGLLGLSSTAPHHSPMKVVLLNKVEVMTVSAGYDHSLALTSTGEVYSWGNGGYGQLGHGDSSLCISTPELIAGLSGESCVSVNAGEFCSFAVTAVGNIWSWGGGEGALGHGKGGNVYEPKLLESLKDTHVLSASVGSVHSVMIVEGGLDSTESFEEEVGPPGVMAKSQTVESVESIESLESSVGSLESGVVIADNGLPLSTNSMEIEVESPDYHHNYEEESPDLQRQQHHEHEQEHEFNREPGSTSSYDYNSSMSNSMLSSLEPSPERADSAGWVDEGEGALSFQIKASSKRNGSGNSSMNYAQPFPELYERETLSKYGDTMARFGYQGFSSSENYRKKYGGSRDGGGNNVTEDDGDRITDLSSLNLGKNPKGNTTPTTTTTGYLDLGGSRGGSGRGSSYRGSVSRGSRGSGGGGGGGGGGDDGISLFNILKGSDVKKMNKTEARLYRWLEEHDLQEMYESLHNSGFTSLESLTNPRVSFTDEDLVELGVFKKGLRMQFLALLGMLRSWKLVATVVRGEGMKTPLLSCSPSRRRVSVTWMDSSKVTTATAGKAPVWNKTMIFPSVDQSKVKDSEVVVEMDTGGKKASCVVSYNEINMVGGSGGGRGGEMGGGMDGVGVKEMGDGKPYPLVNNKTGSFEGCVWLKLYYVCGGYGGNIEGRKLFG
ncbi:hypothetical protein TrVE_jg11399 [Triparma verrucosa]|uniref:RCC1-like domain-containing protein n=1 Tax=Triparma verrucosa TaxID=1606542 RepID=A0A9W7KR98_9STRA|nr:hypothetical protein TrVE_jg11399 [Triparma verrucosa]